MSQGLRGGGTVARVAKPPPDCTDDAEWEAYFQSRLEQIKAACSAQDAEFDETAERAKLTTLRQQEARDATQAREAQTAREAQPWRRPSVVIGAALATVVVFQQCTGWSIPFGGSGVPDSWRPREAPPQPEPGDYFASGAQVVTTAGTALQLASSTAWWGAASDAYGAAHQTLTALTQQLADADRQLKRAVDDHADTVARTRFVLGMVQDLLILALIAVLATEWYWYAVEFFPLWLWILAWTTALSAITAGATELGLCCEDSKRHGHTANSIGYNDMTRTAQQVVAAYRPAPSRSVRPSTGTGLTDFPGRPANATLHHG